MSVPPRWVVELEADISFAVIHGRAKRCACGAQLAVELFSLESTTRQASFLAH